MKMTMMTVMVMMITANTTIQIWEMDLIRNEWILLSSRGWGDTYSHTGWLQGKVLQFVGVLMMNAGSNESDVVSCFILMLYPLNHDYHTYYIQEYTMSCFMQDVSVSNWGAVIYGDSHMRQVGGHLELKGYPKKDWHILSWSLSEYIMEDERKWMNSLGGEPCPHIRDLKLLLFWFNRHLFDFPLIQNSLFLAVLFHHPDWCDDLFFIFDPKKLERNKEGKERMKLSI